MLTCLVKDVLFNNVKKTSIDVQPPEENVIFFLNPVTLGLIVALGAMLICNLHLYFRKKRVKKSLKTYVK